jgi:hypothetical protein
MPFSVDMLVAKESLRNSCASSTMIWSTPISEMVSRSSLRVESASSRSFRPSFSRSSRLRETRSSPSTLVSSVLVELQLVLDHLLLEGGGDGDELEGRMGDDDRVPGRGRRPRQEARALVLGEVGLVGDEDAGIRIERQELARRLRQAMAGHDQHRLGDQAEPALLHDGGRHRHRLAGADGVGEIGRAIGDDAPDAALLVPIKRKGARGAGKLQMGAVEGAARYC